MEKFALWVSQHPGVVIAFVGGLIGAAVDQSAAERRAVQAEAAKAASEALGG
jgi:hypothetical protein